MGLTIEEFIEMTGKCPIIPAIKNDEWLASVQTADCDLAYILYGNICNIADIVDQVKEAGKKAIVHVDLIAGLASKEFAVDFLKKYTKADGVISMKPMMIKRARELNFFTIQRFYTIDALSYANVVKHAKNCDPDVVEIMPAGLTKIIGYLLEDIKKPIIASGLVMDEKDVMGVLKVGALAVSTTNRPLWNC